MVPEPLVEITPKLALPAPWVMPIEPPLLDAEIVPLITLVATVIAPVPSPVSETLEVFKLPEPLVVIDPEPVSVIDADGPEKTPVILSAPPEETEMVPDPLVENVPREALPEP